MIRGLIAGAIGVFALALVVDSNVVGKDKEPASIKAVMKKAHTAPKGELTLLDKVIKGKASDDEKKQLLDLYSDMAKDTPPMNDDQDWKDRTKALVAAAKAGDAEALKTASNCMGCHSEHKAKKKKA
jgi:hypothetical protein